jgi:hypothetical protein
VLCFASFVHFYHFSLSLFGFVLLGASERKMQRRADFLLFGALLEMLPPLACEGEEDRRDPFGAAADGFKLRSCVSVVVKE